MKRKLKKILSVLLVISVIFNVGIMGIQAKTNQKEKKVKQKEIITEVKELVDERTENSNTYLLSDGSKRVDICSQKIRYQEKGRLKEYDSSLAAMDKADRQKLKELNHGDSLGKYIAVNKSGDSKQYFPQHLDKETPVVMNKGKYSLSFAPTVDEKYNSVIDGNKITYKANGIISEYEYTSQKNGVKENIVLSSKPSKNEICFKVDSKNITFIEDKQNKYIYFVDTESRQKVGYILPPNMKDSKGNINYEDISYKIIKNGNEISLKLIIDKKYLERASYPVAVDPTAVWFLDQYLPTAMVSSMQFVRDQTLHPSEFVIKNKCDPTFPYKGTEQRLYLDTSHVIGGDSYIGDKVEWNKKIIKRAQLSVAESTSNYTAGTVEVKKVKNSWSAENITWNTQPELGDTIASFQCNGVDRNRHTLDITEAVTEMISNGELNNGLAFVAKESGTGEVINGPELGPSYMWFSVEYYDAKINMTQYNWETKKETKFDYYYDNIQGQQIEIGQTPEGNTTNNNISTYSIVPGGSLDNADSTIYPYSAVIQLVGEPVINSQGKREYPIYGSGYVIGPNTIITAAHCLIDKGKWLDSIRIYYKSRGDYETASYSYVKTATCATSYIEGLAEYDWAILKVDDNIGNKTGWLGFGITNNSLKGKELTVSGYTLYKESNDTAYVLHKDEGVVVSEDNYFIRYNASTLPGESGGVAFDSSYVAWGTHIAGGGTYNVATRYKSYLFQYMKAQKENDLKN